VACESRSLIRFKEKGGKEKEIPVHHKLEEILAEYLKFQRGILEVAQRIAGPR
jgi:hypothetical protein